MLVSLSSASSLNQTKSELGFLRTHVMVIQTTEPDAESDELEFLDKFVTGARVLALGEPTHGGHEVFQLKHRIIRYLVEVYGFTAIVLEANVSDVQAIDDYVSGGRISLETALEELYTFFNNREMQELLEWIRNYNESAVEPVSLFGIDIQSPWSAAREVLAFLSRVEPEFYAVAQKLYSPVFELEHDWNPAALARLSPILLRNSTQVLEHLTSFRDLNKSQVVNGAYADALNSAQLVVQLAQSQYDNLPSRDQSMAANLLRLLQVDPDARVILWAHDAHIQEAEPARYASGAMGAYLANELGESYRSIGVVVAQGNSRAVDPSTGRWIPHELPLLPNTVGGKLHKLNLGPFFLDMGKVEGETDAQWLFEQQTFRWAGAGPRSFFRYLVPGKAFDALIFIDAISPTRAR